MPYKAIYFSDAKLTEHEIKQIIYNGHTEENPKIKEVRARIYNNIQQKFKFIRIWPFYDIFYGVALAEIHDDISDKSIMIFINYDGEPTINGIKISSSSYDLVVAYLNTVEQILDITTSESNLNNILYNLNKFEGTQIILDKNLMRRRDELVQRIKNIIPNIW